MDRTKQYQSQTGNDEDFLIWENGEQLYLIDFRDLEQKPKEKKKPQKQLISENELNDLNGSEWTIRGKSVQTFNGLYRPKKS